MQFSFYVFVLVGFFCLFGINKFDVQGSVHRKYIPKYDQQDATLYIFLFLYTALHVSGGSPTHHQEHNTVCTASGIRQTVTAAVTV